jgi:hypothetical protein
LSLKCSLLCQLPGPTGPGIARFVIGGSRRSARFPGTPRIRRPRGRQPAARDSRHCTRPSEPFGMDRLSRSYY